MKVLFLCGNHPRHLYLARRLAATGRLAALGIEIREAHVPRPPEDLTGSLRSLFVEHFARRDRTEAYHFGKAEAPNLPDGRLLRFMRDDLNGPMVADLIDTVQPDILLSYGVHKLTTETLSHAKGERWNIHGGLSPEYRGVTTHFWPSYMLEPQMTGMTVHNLTDQLDGGDIVHQSVAELIRGDGMHDLAARAVLALGEDLPRILEKAEAWLSKGKPVPKVPQKGNGKLWLASDWRPEHLRQIYEVWDDAIVDACLDGHIAGRRPDPVQLPAV